MNQKGFVKIVIIVIIVALLGVVGYLVVKNISSSRISQESAPMAFIPSPVGQFLLDGTSFETRRNAEYSYTVIATLPTGNTAETMFRLDPKRVDLGSMAAPSIPSSPLRALTLSHRLTAKGLEWSYEYVIPENILPANGSTAAPGRGLSAWRWHVAQALAGPSHAHASQDDGVRVVATGVLQEFGAEGLSQIEERVASVKGSSLVTAGGALLNVSGALDLSAQHQNIEQRLAALRRCAENPTNALTKKMYANDPQSKERILAEVARVETETKMDTTVRFIGALNSQASGLVNWLGFVVGPLTSWTDAGIARLGEERVNELEKSVTKCEEEEKMTEKEKPSSEPQVEPRSIDESPQTKRTPRPPGWYGTISYVAETNYVSANREEHSSNRINIQLSGDDGTWKAVLSGSLAEPSPSCSTLTTTTGSGSGPVLIGTTGFEDSQGAVMGFGEKEAAVNIDLSPEGRNYTISFITPFVSFRERWESSGHACYPPLTGDNEAALPISGGVYQKTLGADPNALSGSETLTQDNSTITTTWNLTHY